MVTGGTDNLPQVVRVAQRQEALGDLLKRPHRVSVPCAQLLSRLLGAMLTLA